MARGSGLWMCGFWMGGLLAVGCSSAGQTVPSSCGRVQPIGGDVVGTWTFVGACENLVEENAELASSCPGETIHSSSSTRTGSITLDANLTFTTTTWNETGASSQTIPLSCIGSASCAAVVAPAPAGSGLKTSCTGDSACACETTDTETVPADAGTYSIDGARLILAGAHVATTLQFGVEGSRLHWLQVSSTRVGPNQEAIILSDLVAEKQ